MSPPTAYSPPSFEAEIDLDLSKNEGPAPSRSLLDSIADPSGLMGRYPDTAELRDAIADLNGVDPGQVLVTAGGDDALLRCFLSLAGPDGEVAATTPSFEMIPRYAAQVGARLVEVPWWAGDFPVEAIEDSISTRTRMVFAVSPNNPTGSVISETALRRLAGAGPLVVLDAAYEEFADIDLTPVALGLDNVVVIKTLSKAWGLAGLRVGYLIASKHLVERIGAFGNPYPVSGLSQALASGRLADRDEMARFVKEVRSEREELTRLLGDRGIEVLDSQANFVLASFDDPGWVRSAAASLGVGLRTFPERAGLESHVRITLPGQRAGFERLVHVLASVIDPEALLFDLDGVLADVEQSQTKAIIETAAHLGAVVTRHDVEMTRAAGNANDDWELTWRLCTDAGVRVSLEEVTHRFETIYQGSDGEPGLKLNETVLVDPTTMAALAARLPIGVVTGRPRSDAEEFLGRFGLGEWLSALVTREDAALKPDPEPVRLAMERLGVDTAWMVGDTPDDVTAARAAGVVPVGVIPPGRDPGLARIALAGAARVLDETADLKEILR